MTNIQHILHLSKEDKRKFFNSFDFIFCDCDGVVWAVLGPIPNTSEAINLLKDAGKKFKFVSNNSLKSEKEYLEKFKKLGVCNVIPDDIIHPAKSISNYIQKHYSKDSTFFSICSNTANDYFREKGINIETLEIAENLTPVTYTEKMNLNGKQVKAVLFDANLNLSLAHLARAALYLQQSDCDLISGGAGSCLPSNVDVTSLGFSYFKKYLDEHHKRESIILGKPGKELGEVLMETYQIEDPKRVLFIGDFLEQDINFGKKIGFQTLLVLTGIASKQDMLEATAQNRPDYYADSLLDFISFLKDLKEM